jgi:shikimate kinase / 3-dehydroquinate synthase
MPDGIVLVGLPGSGKSVVGRRIAGLLGRPFVDTDELIERSTGVTPADHIRADGEPAFRDLERRAVVEACAVPGAVIGAGGGAVLDPRNRWAFMDHGLRVRLDAPIETLAGRLAGAAPPRPLLGADIRAGLERTADERSAVYAAVDAVVDASSDPATVAADVIDASLSGSWRTLYEGHYARHHPVGPEHGRVLMGRGIDRASLERALKAFAGRDAVTVADRRALEASPSLQAALPNRRLRAMDGGEASKSFAELERLLTWLSELGAERGDPLLVAGGGTLGDVGGLAAALHRRGMPLVQLPTTWLAQADSALGGKVAIDLPGAKNAVGAFWSPWLIV